MIKWIKNFIHLKVKEGGKVTFYTTGRRFNPTDQQRTTATQDFIKQKEKETKSKLDKVFGINDGA